MKFEVKVFEFALNVFKKQLVSSLNFESVPLKLQIPILFFFNEESRKGKGEGGSPRQLVEKKTRID
jgi:hypothetical protein